MLDDICTAIWTSVANATSVAVVKVTSVVTGVNFVGVSDVNFSHCC